ncbi:DUF5979 domain-containing protein [Lachnospiraceae bacterium 29-84]
MEIKKSGTTARLSRRLIGSLLVFLLAVGVVAFTPGLDGEAGAVDFDRACSLTVAPGSEDLAADLQGADVVVDLYKIADAEPVSGQDTYTYAFLEGYQDAKAVYEANTNQADWTKMAQAAARVALDGKAPAVTGAAVNAPMKDLGCGLYLVIARGAELEDYKVTVKEEDGTEELATIADSDTYTYTYAPALISLPGKEREEGDPTTSADSGAWLYDMSVTLKPSQEVRYGSLEIVKTLQSYETKDPATFVFDIEAVKDGEVVYSNVASLSFTEAGQKHTLLEGIPVGAVVTVREVYSGNAYEAVTNPEQTTTIVANEVASVSFTNDYNETNNGGGAVTNHFENDDENGWSWTQIPDNSTDAR